MIVHASDLSAWARCAAAYGYSRRGLPDKTNSATAFGSVIHAAIETLERSVWDLRSDYDRDSPEFVKAIEEGVAKANEIFVYYWLPSNIEAICPRVPEDGWIAGQTYSELRNRGIETIRSYAEMLRSDTSTPLAFELPFQVTLDGTWDEEEERPHLLAGRMDRVALALRRRVPVLAAQDYKSGKQPNYLRHNIQGTVYAYATTKPEFWTGQGGEVGFGDDGLVLHEKFKELPRQFVWVNLQTAKFVDGGLREAQDYARLKLAVEQMVASIRADIYPLSISGENCTYCNYRDICGGIGLPEDEDQ